MECSLLATCSQGSQDGLAVIMAEAQPAVSSFDFKGFGDVIFQLYRCPFSILKQSEHSES